jgi:hypothetical protein
MGSIKNRITSPFKTFGPAAGLAYIISRSLAAVSTSVGVYVYDFMVQPITEKALLPTRLAKDVEIREVREDERILGLMPPPQEVIASRFAQGAFCLGAFSDSELIAYIWFCNGRYSEDEMRCEYVLDPANQSVFDFDVYVFPQHRLGLAFVALWNGANRYLYERGIRHSFSRLNRFNISSKRAHDRLGWKRIAGAVIFKAGRFEAMFTSATPYVSLSRVSRPRLRLAATVTARDQ